MLKKFNDKLPERVYLDPSVLINSIITTSRFHTDCSNLMKSIRNKNIECVISSLSIDEIWYVLIKTVVEDEKNNFLVNEYKKNPKSILLARNIVERITFDLLMVKNFRIVSIDEEIILSANDYLWGCLLLPRDAIHLATSLKYGVKGIITTNSDFKNASKFVDIYLP